MKAFDEHLYEQVNDMPHSLRRTRLLRVLELPEGNPRRQRVLSHLETSAKAHLGHEHDDQVDWSAAAIDWNGLLAFIMKIMPMILALFGLWRVMKTKLNGNDWDTALKEMLTNMTKEERLRMLILAAKIHGPKSIMQRKREYNAEYYRKRFNMR